MDISYHVITPTKFQRRSSHLEFSGFSAGCRRCKRYCDFIGTYCVLGTIIFIDLYMSCVKFWIHSVIERLLSNWSWVNETLMTFSAAPLETFSNNFLFYFKNNVDGYSVEFHHSRANIVLFDNTIGHYWQTDHIFALSILL